MPGSLPSRPRYCLPGLTSQRYRPRGAEDQRAFAVLRFTSADSPVPAALACDKIGAAGAEELLEVERIVSEADAEIIVELSRDGLRGRTQPGQIHAHEGRARNGEPWPVKREVRSESLQDSVRVD